MAVVATVMLIGCSTDSPLAPNTAPGASADLGMPAARQQAGIIVEPPVRQRFGPISINPVSLIRVGTPVSLEISADVNIPTARAHAEIEVPEIAEIAYRSTHGMQSRARRNPGVQLFWRGVAQKGQRQIRQRVSVVFPVAGLYYVRAAVASDDPEIEADGVVQNTAAPQVVWVNVTSTGGAVIHSLEALNGFQRTNVTRDPVLQYAAQYAAAPSTAPGLSAQPALIPICDPNDPTCEPPPPPGPSPTQFSGTLLYYNARLGYNVALPRATIGIFDTRGTGFNSVTQTDANGNFTLACPPSYERGYLQMAASSVNTDVKVLVVNRPSMPQADLGYWPDDANAAVDRCGTYTGNYAVGAPSQAEAFDNTSQTATKSRQLFAVTRDPIGVNFVDGPNDLTLANYSTITDSITIHEGYATGSYGLFVAAHEYGHAVHEKKLGHIIITPANASDPTCTNHSYTLVTNYQCAYREGIVDYQAVAVWGATLGDTLYPEFNNGDFAGAPVGTGFTPIGPSTEGAIASTLLHMGDGTGSRTVYRSGYGYLYYNDNVAFTHATIAAAIRDCSVILSNSILVRADGIDYLAYCLEKPASYQSACVYGVTGSATTTPASSTATTPAATPATSPANTGPPGCQPLPGFYSPTITQDERDKFVGLRGAFPTPAVQWQLGQWGAGVPQRNGYDQNVRTVWMCNLFFCS
ncbi:MAG: hypothetical protein ABI026_00945 [Gemmatimonadaceae bacterium]